MKIEHNRLKKYKDSFEWHRWFAWYPVTAEGNIMIWLDWVERRRVSNWYEVLWEYRDMKIGQDGALNKR